ncbi:1-phosphofructokinase [Paenibacillus sp. YPG26]|uniref:1-phosphofructokinase n=1 Tax=Paenibacillus sp. YPG26 TaxID=2878915 RepID=UPI00203A38FF|nr:1-phosphofructokinase [Paenibacillus sp. YPG26]USB32185.1 1-phosphofructokinase [Paenibacillus sp. YPG26]
MSAAVITVTLNPALDKTVTLEELQVGALNRVRASRVDPGGKGINVAKVLGNFQVSVTATGFVGGYSGRQLLEGLDELGVQHAFIQVDEETRTNLKIVDVSTSITTEINERGSLIKETNMLEFMEQMESMLEGAEVLVLGGSIPPGIPPGIYRTLTDMASHKNVKTILDADGEALAEGLQGKPYAIKPNIHELEQLVNRKLESMEAIVQACRGLLQEGIQLVVVSMGADGAIFASADEVLKTSPFSIKPKSTVGAGDSMVASMASSIIAGHDLERLARAATAAGSITASKEGTEVCSKNEVNESMSLVGIDHVDCLDE